MSKIKAPLKTKLQNSLAGVGFTLQKPLYLATVPVIAFFASFAVTWILNLELMQFIIATPALSPLQKIEFFFEAHILSITNTLQPFNSLRLIMFGLLFGLNTVLFVQVWRMGALRRSSKSTSGLGFATAAIGGGCAACGATILTPILATIGVTSTQAVAQTGSFLNWLSILLLLYSIYLLGSLINNGRKA